jgi:ribonuclease-3
VLGIRAMHWPGPFVTAFTHTTAVGIPGAGTESYERLEFLGDAVLGFVVGQHLYESRPGAAEGALTLARTKLVSGKVLAEMARRMGLGSLLLMSPISAATGVHRSPRVLEDVFEAAVGAVFLDAGMAGARRFVLRCIEAHVDQDSLHKNTNYKDQLMRLCHARQEALPHYADDAMGGGGFRTLASACGERGAGTGPTKRAAQQHAARSVLVKLGEEVDL